MSRLYALGAKEFEPRKLRVNSCHKTKAMLAGGMASLRV